MTQDQPKYIVRITRFYSSDCAGRHLNQSLNGSLEIFDGPQMFVSTLVNELVYKNVWLQAWKWSSLCIGSSFWHQFRQELKLYFVISEIHICIHVWIMRPPGLLRWKTIFNIELKGLETKHVTTMLLVRCHSSVLKTRQSKLSWDSEDVNTMVLAKLSTLAALARMASSGSRQTNVQYSQQTTWTRLSSRRVQWIFWLKTWR